MLKHKGDILIYSQVVKSSKREFYRATPSKNERNLDNSWYQNDQLSTVMIKGSLNFTLLEKTRSIFKRRIRFCSFLFYMHYIGDGRLTSQHKHTVYCLHNYQKGGLWIYRKAMSFFNSAWKISCLKKDITVLISIEWSKFAT